MSPRSATSIRTFEKVVQGNNVTSHVNFRNWAYSYHPLVSYNLDTTWPTTKVPLNLRPGTLILAKQSENVPIYVLRTHT